jgi:hypothetical protein
VRFLLLFLFSINCFAYLTNADKQAIVGVNDFTANGGFEKGQSDWTNSGATFSVQDTTVLDGSYSASWDAAADGNTLTSDLFTIPTKLAGNNVVFCFLYKGGDTNIRFRVLDNDSNVLVNDTLSPQTDSYLHCQTSGVSSSATGLQFALEADADAAVIYADNFAFALAELVNISNISQDEIWSGTHGQDCSWATTSATAELATGDATCTFTSGAINENFATVSSVSDGTGNQAGISYTPSTTGTFEVCTTVGSVRQTGTATSYAYLYIDDSEVFRTMHIDDHGSPLSICQPFEVTSTSTAKQIDIRISTDPTTMYGGIGWSIKKISTTSQQAINPSTQMVASGVKITANSSNRISSTGGAYAVADDADIEDDKTHYGSATSTTDASNVGFTMPYLKANTRYFVFANVRMWTQYTSSETTCRYKIYDGTNDITEGRFSANSDSADKNSYTIYGTISYDSVQTDKEFSIYFYRESGGGTCYVDMYHTDAEIGIIPLTEGMNAITLETQWKQYDLTVEASNWATTRAVGLPYKDINGVWRLKFNIVGTGTSASTYALSVSGVVFKTGAFQSVTVYTSTTTSTVGKGYAYETSDDLILASSVATTIWRISGDVELDEKPSWATGVWN